MATYLHARRAGVYFSLTKCRVHVPSHRQIPEGLLDPTFVESWILTPKNLKVWHRLPDFVSSSFERDYTESSDISLDINEQKGFSAKQCICTYHWTSSSRARFVADIIFIIEPSVVYGIGFSELFIAAHTCTFENELPVVQSVVLWNCSTQYIYTRCWGGPRHIDNGKHVE